MSIAPSLSLKHIRRSEFGTAGRSHHSRTHVGQAAASARKKVRRKMRSAENATAAARAGMSVEAYIAAERRKADELRSGFVPHSGGGTLLSEERLRREREERAKAGQRSW